MPPLNNSIKLSVTYPIFLIGFMGCGKTTMGRKIANKSGIPFIDLDHQIVEASGMSISNYFEIHGEEGFRNLESQLLKSIPVDHAGIISTGGGVPCFHNNMDWMNENGMTIYLKLAPKALLKRLSGKEGAGRPLLQGKNTEEMLDFITLKLEEREVFYNKAKLILDVHEINPTLVLDLLSIKLQSK